MNTTERFGNFILKSVKDLSEKDIFHFIGNTFDKTGWYAVDVFYALEYIKTKNTQKVAEIFIKKALIYYVDWLVKVDDGELSILMDNFEDTIEINVSFEDGEHTLTTKLNWRGCLLYQAYKGRGVDTEDDDSDKHHLILEQCHKDVCRTPIETMFGKFQIKGFTEIRLRNKDEIYGYMIVLNHESFINFDLVFTTRGYMHRISPEKCVFKPIQIPKTSDEVFVL